MIFSELYVKHIPFARIFNDSGPHIVVLVHGYQGSGFDMRSWKTNLALMYPHLVVLTSGVNEGEITDGDLEMMGQRLA
jgi:hypothetical protein